MSDALHSFEYDLQNILFWFDEASEAFSLFCDTAYRGLLLLHWICGAVLIWDQSENPLPYEFSQGHTSDYADCL